MQLGVDADTAQRGTTNWLHDMDEFRNEMQARFGDIHKIDCYRQLYKKLIQKNSVQDYLQDFDTCYGSV
jgi:hypothetical protein